MENVDSPMKGIQKQSHGKLYHENVRKDSKLIYEESKHTHSFRQTRVNMLHLPTYLVRDYDQQDVCAVDMGKIDKRYDSLQRFTKELSLHIGKYEAFLSDGEVNNPIDPKKKTEFDTLKETILKLRDRLKDVIEDVDESITLDITRVNTKRQKESNMRQGKLDKSVLEKETNPIYKHLYNTHLDGIVIEGMTERSIDPNFSSVLSEAKQGMTMNENLYNKILVTNLNRNQKNMMTLTYNSDGNKVRIDPVIDIKHLHDRLYKAPLINNQNAYQYVKVDNTMGRMSNSRKVIVQERDFVFRLDSMRIYLEKSRAILNRAEILIKKSILLI